ncbi:hypothetical protein Alches_18710 [Alicyclobacillus hesperidum subsp. aegles]|uniref:phage neck terminator protein n=2 Tax=Alicyclobacillus hesperidum TaxID=89784 RepID=UPI00222CB616|nr:hypothetical protein [Alicyclobacillus hesperidum]GLG01830.1 hypothetical protein Alches_18710 [Alicyclobacillus hesperidum subsp. aegles]
MADTVLTETQIEDLFQSWTSQVLGVTDPSAVRIGWPMDGSPAWEIGSDVCFILVSYADSPYTRQIQTDYAPLDDANAQVNQTYTVGLRVSWTFYGPNAFSHADLVRSALYLDSTTQTLASSNVALVTDVPMPLRAPELFDGQWWDRVTFWAQFNELVMRQSSVPYIGSATISVEDDQGDSEVVQVVEG